jgi:hypothetical protein
MLLKVAPITKILPLTPSVFVKIVTKLGFDVNVKVGFCGQFGVFLVSNRTKNGYESIPI